MKIIKVDPAERLNAGAIEPPDTKTPRRLRSIPQYRCPDCGRVTAFSMPSQNPSPLFDKQTHTLFEAATKRQSDYYPALADGRCQECGRCFRVVADYDELHMAHFVYDAITVLELVDA